MMEINRSTVFCWTRRKSREKEAGGKTEVTMVEGRLHSPFSGISRAQGIMGDGRGAKGTSKVSSLFFSFQGPRSPAARRIGTRSWARIHRIDEPST